MSSAAESKLREWREHPSIFVREVFGATPDAWQDEVLEAFPHKNRIALKACKGPGKSTVEAWCGWNFLLTRPHPKVIATSITGDNLKDGLWSEFSKWQQKSPLLIEAFTWSAERIASKQHPETWFASARTWAKGADASQQANTLAGIHAEYVLFLVDEAGGIPSGVVAAAEGGLSTGTETKLFISGNPTHLEGPLYTACTRDRALWYVVEITGDPDDPKRSPRIDIEWARQLIAKEGRDNPWVMVNVLGKFPPGQSNKLLGVEEVGAAAERVLGERDYMDEAKVLGVDVARFGDDESVIVMRQGKAMFRPLRFRNLDTVQLAGQVALVMEKEKPDGVFIDETGIGAGVVDLLKSLSHQVTGVQFGAGAAQAKKFKNRRVEMWWAMAEWLKSGGCIPDDAGLRAELCAPTYWFDGQGRICLEAKDDLKARGLPSPDCADGLALTLAMPVIARARIGMAGSQRKARTEYNPHAEPQEAVYGHQ